MQFLILIQALRVGSKSLRHIKFIPTRSAVSFKRAECKSMVFASKTQPHLCPYKTARMEKLAEEAAEKNKSFGIIFRTGNAEKKACPKFCAYLEKQCPPLVPPIVKAKPQVEDKPTAKKPKVKVPEIRMPAIPRTDVPAAAVMAYRIAL